MRLLKLNRGLKMAGAFAALCFTVLLGTGLDASPAKAATFSPTGNYRIINESTNKAMAVEQESLQDHANVQQQPNQSKWHQQWRIQPAEDGYYKLVNANSGKAAYVLGPPMSGSPIRQGNYDASSLIQWDIQAVGSSYIIVNRGSGRVMEVSSNADGAQIVQTNYTGSNTQLWKIEQVNNPLPGIDPAKYYKIKTNGLVMDVTGNLTIDGAAVGLYEDLNQDNQKWQILPVGWAGVDLFRVVNKNSQKSLSIVGPSCVSCSLTNGFGGPGSPVMWFFDYVSPGTYKLKPWGKNNYVVAQGRNLVIDYSFSVDAYIPFTLELAP